MRKIEIQPQNHLEIEGIKGFFVRKVTNCTQREQKLLATYRRIFCSQSNKIREQRQS